MTYFDELWLIIVPVAAAGQLPVCKGQCQRCRIALRLLVAKVSFLDMKSMLLNFPGFLSMTNLLNTFRYAATMCDSCHQSLQRNIVADPTLRVVLRLKMLLGQFDR